MPTPERIAEIKREYFYDELNQFGGGYGQMYRTVPGKKTTVVIGPDMELPVTWN